MLQVSDVPGKGPTDIASTIASSMRRMGVSGLPRNYEIFYEVFTGSNRDLVREFEALNGRPTQEALDKLSLKYFTQNKRQAVVESAQEQIAARAQDILSLLGRERSSLEKFGVILDRTKLAQYKKLADTDPLTRIWNRRAFDKRMADVYDDQRSVMFHALILADIDGFKAFNDHYGHPVGDRILQGVAQILKTQSTTDCFVARTGGEEFAIIVEGLSEEATMKVAEAIRLAVEKAEFVIGAGVRNYGPDDELRLFHISLGVCMAADAGDAEELYAKADQALYASKVDGRNRATLFSRIPKGKFTKNWLLYRQD